MFKDRQDGKILASLNDTFGGQAQCNKEGAGNKRRRKIRSVKLKRKESKKEKG